MTHDGDAVLPDRFEVRRKLGEGSYGVVWEAYDRERRAIVALKLLKRADPHALRWFKNEFRVLVERRHENLVSLYELIAVDTCWLLTMELVGGIDFVSYVRGAGWRDHGATTLVTGDSAVPRAPSAPRTFLDPPAVARLIHATAQLAHGLEALHGADILHCDIKPSNVLVTSDSSKVVLLDFGLATEVVAVSKGRPAVLGTPAYMSPEQAAGERLDGATDWYSVGVMLYEALTGQLPFTGAAWQILASKQAPRRRVGDVGEAVPPALVSLCESLLVRDPIARPGGREVIDAMRALQVTRSRLAIGMSGPIEISDPRSPGPLVGRDAILARLEAAYERSASAPVLVALEGDAGIGKTAVVRHFLDAHAEEATIIESRCHAQADVPFKALDELVDRLSDELIRAPAGADLGRPADRAALEQIFPVLRRHRGVGDQPDALVSPLALLRRATRAFGRFVTALAAHRRLILFIDELHFGDRDSARMLGELFAVQEKPAVLIIVCYQTGTAENDGLPARLLAAGRQSGAVIDEIVLAPLSPEQSRALVAAAIQRAQLEVPESAIASITAESGGNPFVALELARHAHLGTLDLAATVHARLSGLGPDPRRLLEVVAIAGQPVRDALAIRAANLDSSSWRALSALHEAGLLRSTSGQQTNDRRLDTYHDRIRELVLAQIPPETRRAHHLALAKELQALRNPPVAELAHHYRSAGMTGEAARHTEAAAQHAAQMLAFERAAALYGLALELGGHARHDQLRLRRARAGALDNARRIQDSAEEYLRAAELARGRERTELEHLAADQLLRGGHVDRGLALMRRLHAAIDHQGSGSNLTMLATLIRRRAMVRLRLRRQHPQPTRPRRADPDELLELDIEWSVARGLALIDPLRAACAQARAVLLSLHSGDATRLARVLCGEILYSGMGGVRSAERTAALVARVEELARHLDDPEIAALATATRGISAVQEGRFSAGEPLCRQAMSYVDEHLPEASWVLSTLQHFVVFSLYHRGEVAELCRWVPARERDATERGDLHAATDLATHYPNLAWLLELGPDEAARRVREAMRSWSSRRYHAQHYYAVLAIANIDLFAGRGSAAMEAVRGGWSAWLRSGLALAQGMRIDAFELRARAALAAAIDQRGGPRRRSIRTAEMAAGWLERERAPWGIALAALRRAGARGARRDLDGAVAWLRRSVTLLDALDMKLHAASARQRLGRLLGGDEGAAASAAAQAYFAGQGIADSEPLVRMVAPGFDR